MGIVKHDPVDRSEFAALLTGTTAVDATTSTKGVVKKAAAVADLTPSVITDAPVGGTGATEGAYDTAAHRDTAIAAINTAIDSVQAVELKVNDLLAKLRTAGVLSA
ncbi:MAG TPA: hypothetical protein VFM18_21985 [Methanosarcina sp.]|nr:hypothetical protein [Methanosarcina sp.]